MARTSLMMSTARASSRIISSRAGSTRAPKKRSALPSSLLVTPAATPPIAGESPLRPAFDRARSRRSRRPASVAGRQYATKLSRKRPYRRRVHLTQLHQPALESKGLILERRDALRRDLCGLPEELRQDSKI